MRKRSSKSLPGKRNGSPEMNGFPLSIPPGTLPARKSNGTGGDADGVDKVVSGGECDDKERPGPPPWPEKGPPRPGPGNWPACGSTDRRAFELRAPLRRGAKRSWNGDRKFGSRTRRRRKNSIKHITVKPSLHRLLRVRWNRIYILFFFLYLMFMR